MITRTHTRPSSKISTRDYIGTGDSHNPTFTFMDFSNATFAGLPAHQYHRLLSVLNAAARLIRRRRRFYHVTPLLRDLVEGAGESRLQAGCDCLSVPTWHGTAVSERRPATCCRTESEPAAFFSVQCPCRPINQTQNATNPKPRPRPNITAMSYTTGKPQVSRGNSVSQGQTEEA